MRKIFLLTLAVLVSACTGPQTASEFASFLTVSAKTFQFDRSFSAVSTSLKAGANKYLNKTEQGWVSLRVMNGFGTMHTMQQSITTEFSTEFASSPGEIQITMRKTRSAQSINKEGFIWLLIEAKSSEGGTSLSVHAAKYMGDNISVIIRSWANGGALIYPTLDLN